MLLVSVGWPRDKAGCNSQGKCRAWTASSTAHTQLEFLCMLRSSLFECDHPCVAIVADPPEWITACQHVMVTYTWIAHLLRLTPGWCSIPLVIWSLVLGHNDVHSNQSCLICTLYRTSCILFPVSCHNATKWLVELDYHYTQWSPSKVDTIGTTAVCP